jgi:hypothetical protein
MTGDARMARLATLWERESKAGRTYYSGFMGDCQILMFRGEEITRDNGEVVQTWKLFVQERDPSRRPQQKRQQPTRGQSTWDRSRDHDLPTGETRECRNERSDPRQQHIDELARRFDERGPDEVPW